MSRSPQISPTRSSLVEGGSMFLTSIVVLFRRIWNTLHFLSTSRPLPVLSKSQVSISQPPHQSPANLDQDVATSGLAHSRHLLNHLLYTHNLLVYLELSGAIRHLDHDCLPPPRLLSHLEMLLIISSDIAHCIISIWTVKLRMDESEQFWSGSSFLKIKIISRQVFVGLQ